MVELRHVSFGYSPDRKLLYNLSLHLAEGKIYALMGGNGAGKTTLFNIISGFIKPQEGTLLLRDNELTKHSPYKRNRLGIGRTFQDMRIITKLSVQENIILAIKDNPTDAIFSAILPKRLHQHAQKKLEKKAEQIMTQFFLLDIQHAKTGEISYGQQKLLTLACCVANDAPLLLLDEPIAGVQPEYRNKIATLLKQLKTQGKTILLIEHNADFIAEIADAIFFLHEGKMTEYASMEMLRADKKVLEAYSG